MNYIRTKNELVEFNIIRKIMPDVYEVKDIKDRYLHKEEILKQADTIEELCDCCILVGNNNHIPCNKLPYKYYQELARYYELEDFVVYGAIWTSKGLIYKAKMKGILPNGEIDWELL